MKYRYEEMTWQEAGQAVSGDPVAVLPVAVYEDHGPHLPVNTDVFLCTTVCERAVAGIPSEAVLIPPVTHGYSPHHMDFPGTIAIGWQTFINYVKDVCLSLVHHGFKRILIVNGHGSNTSPLDIAARETIIESKGDILCASLNYWTTGKLRSKGNNIRQSDYGGTSHAGEFETSIYLALRPDLVDMDKAVDERSPLSASFQNDLLMGRHPEGAQANMMPFWSSMTKSGVRGDATKATAEKGKLFLEAAVEGLMEFIREFKETDILPRKKHN
jgi:creatinine amidohydrolase